MMKVSILHIFSDPNGKVIYKPFDDFEKCKKNDQSDFVRFTRK